MKKGYKNITASLRQRLLNKARETGRPFNELLQYFAMERFLYRLSKSPYANDFVLKGALMLIVWNAPLSRPTMDIDLLGHSTERKCRDGGSDHQSREKNLGFWDLIYRIE